MAFIYEKKQQVNQWGSQFKDRKNSFDDDDEIKIFISKVNSTDDLKEYISGYLPTKENIYKWKEKPNGTYGVDLGIVDENDKLVLVIDLERWSAWGDDFPRYYKCLSFLERKAKFLRDDIPFLMVWQNNDCSKYVIVDDEDIRKIKPITKTFKSGFTDTVRELPKNYGRLFGENLTSYEKSIFNCF